MIFYMLVNLQVRYMNFYQSFADECKHTFVISMHAGKHWQTAGHESEDGIREMKKSKIIFLKLNGARKIMKKMRIGLVLLLQLMPLPVSIILSILFRFFHCNSSFSHALLWKIWDFELKPRRTKMKSLLKGVALLILLSNCV